MRYLHPVIALSFIALTPQPVLAEKDNFQVYNNTGTTLERLYITETEDGGWGRDILGRAVLPNGHSVGINFANPSSRVCSYDLRAVFSTGEILNQYRVNVCTVDRYSIYRRPSRTVNYY